MSDEPLNRQRKWQLAHPERRTAHQRVNTAIRSGRLQKQPCEVCGTTENIDGHHDRYDQPLVVRWLCRLHHAQHHAAERRGASK